jgi:nitrogen PTS system EIIA component
MNIAELISPKSIVPHLKATSKKQALQELARRISEMAEVDVRVVFDALLERERLGSTAVGDGIAIPHARIDGLDRIHGLFARADRGIEFDAVDGRPVDLIFLLLAPAAAGADHLKALARIARLFRDRGTCDRLRGCESADAIFALLTEPPASNAA